MTKNWTAEQWGEWAAGFCKFTTYTSEMLQGKEFWQWNGGDIDKDAVDPLHDANHLMLVLDEIERRSADKENISAPWTLECWKDEGKNVYGCGVHHVRGMTAEVWSPQSSTRNLAVLRAAHALDEEK